jgi:hypothetical protein
MSPLPSYFTVPPNKRDHFPTCVPTSMTPRWHIETLRLYFWSFRKRSWKNSKLSSAMSVCQCIRNNRTTGRILYRVSVNFVDRFQYWLKCSNKNWTLHKGVQRISGGTLSLTRFVFMGGKNDSKNSCIKSTHLRFILNCSYRALSLIEHTILKPTKRTLIILDIIYYNICRLIQHRTNNICTC